MSTRDNAPPPPDWKTPCRCGTCDVCDPAEDLSLPRMVVLGEN